MASGNVGVTLMNEETKMKSIGMLTVVALTLSSLSAYGSEAEHNKQRQSVNCQPFSQLRMTLEQNASDGDAEIVLFAKGQDDGLHALSITAPDGHKVANFTGNRKGIGIREFALESAEPLDLNLVLKSFPEGIYRVRGAAVTGGCLVGSAYLSHQVAPATTLLTPAENAVVSVNNVELSWSHIAEAVLYTVELKNKSLNSKFSFQIFPPTANLAIPAAMLAPDSLYQFSVAVTTTSGNITSVETLFFTTP